MRSLLAVLAVCCLLALASPRAQAQFVEVFGGYSYVHDSVPITGTACPVIGACVTTTSTYHSNLNGWEVAGTIKPGTWYGITADFGGTYGSVLGSSMHLQTYLFGPKLSFPGPVSPFVHALVGAAHSDIAAVSTSNTAFALAIGGGIDIKLAPFVAFRPIQIDYLLTHFNSSTQSQPRVSIGLVLRF
jgi:hypothetical protein